MGVICFIYELLRNRKAFFSSLCFSSFLDFFSFRYAAKDKRTLQAHHITHVLNAADGKFNVNTGPSFYRDTKITYHGVEAFDMPSFNLSPFFYPAANFIKNALSLPTGEELSPCSRYFTLNLSETFFFAARHRNRNICQSSPIREAPSCISH